MKTILSVSIGDIARNEEGDEILISDSSGNIILLSNSLEVLNGWPIKLKNVSTAPSIGDIDGDGSLDIVVGGENKIYCYNYSATILSGWPRDLAYSKNLGIFNSSISLFNMNNNEKVELFAPSPDGNLRILDSKGDDYIFKSGDNRFTRTYTLGSGSGRSAAIDNIDSDSEMEIFAINDSGWLYCYTLPGIEERDVEWGALGASYARTFAYTDSLMPKYKESNNFSIEDFQAYPNPSFEKTFSVRYKLSKSMTKVEFTLYNSAGRKLQNIKTLPTGAGENHYKINVNRYAPGIYLLKLTAENSEKRSIKFTKIGLIR